MSDLHLEKTEGVGFVPMTPKPYDVAVLAGDIASSPAHAVEWAYSSFSRAVVLVPGNHEFVGGDVGRRLRDGLKAADGLPSIHLLSDSWTIVDGIRFVGSTLWTSYDLYGYPDTSLAVARGLPEFASTSIGKQRFTPYDALRLHRQSVHFLDKTLSDPFSGPTVVVTHHAPSSRSIPDRWRGDPLSPAYASNLEWLLERHSPAVWVHGHVHTPCSYMLGRTHVVCMPKGYAAENPDFKSALMVELEV